MLRAYLFNKFFKYKEHNSNQIIKYTSNEKFNLQKKINNKILEIDKKISENSMALLQAQMVKIRSTFSKSNSFIEKIGQNVYKTRLEESIHWHQKTLKELYFKRRELQISLEKIKGIFWFNRIKRILTIICTLFFVIFSLFVFLSGFMIVIYLLPIIIIIYFIYLIGTKKY